MSFDLYLEGIAAADQEQGKFLTFGDYDRHIGVDGIHKLMMRFLKCMLTPKGSDFTDPDYGTDLAALFNTNADTRLIGQVASQAVTDTVGTLRAYDAEYEIDDAERILAAEITDLSIDETGPRVDLVVQITNVEGTQALFLVPAAVANNEGTVYGN
jgi:hypothetical protein